MLLGVGQAASYAQHSVTSAVGGSVSNSSQKVQQSLNRPLLASTNHRNNKFNNNSSSSRPITTAINSTTTLMKTLAVRLHRGTEYIKDTVHRTLVDSTSTKAVSSPSDTSSTTPTSTSSSLASEVVHKTKASAAPIVTTSSASTKQYIKELNKDLQQIRHLQQQQQQKQHSKSNLNEIPPPTALHRSTDARQNAGSTDSLLKELCHFKPIRPMPLTRNKLGNKPPGCDIKTPKFVKATKNVYAFDSIYNKTNSSTSCSSRSTSTNLLSSQSNLHQSSVLKAASSNSTKATPHTMTRQQQCKSAFVCLKINGNEIIKTKQQSKIHSNLNDEKPKQPKRRRRRRRNAFGVPRRRVVRKKLMDEFDDDDDTVDSINPTVRNINVKQSQQEKRTYQRKRKTTIKQLIEEEEDDDVSDAATDDYDLDNDPINNLQPTKSKRKRLTKDCQGMNDTLNVSSSSSSLLFKNISVGSSKSKLMNTKLKETKKISRINKLNETTIRCSPPMTRQRARQISYNQSK